MNKRQRSGARAAIRPVALSAAACTALCVFVVRPAYADPAVPNVPDSGSRPPSISSVTGSDTVGGTGTGTGTGIGAGLPTGPGAMLPPGPVAGPLIDQINGERATVELLGERRLQAEAELTVAAGATAATERAWRDASDRLAELRDLANAAAGDAYKAAIALGPFGAYAGDLHELSVLAPGLGSVPGGESIAREVAAAEETERTTSAAYRSARDTQASVSARLDQIKLAQSQHTATLTDLVTRNAALVARADAAREAAEQAIGASLNIGGSVDGMTANQKALAAVQMALNQLGKPYVWGTEGPNTFDCSGLMWYAYHSVGVNLPRVSSDQYHALPHVPISKLLPGDLLFFGTDRSDWTSIHHVGMYIGNGRMVHAPTTGDVVKISPVWWSEFFGAARVVGEVPAPSTARTRPPSPSPTPSKSPSPTPSKSVSPSPTPSKSVSPTPSTTPSLAPAPTSSSTSASSTTSTSASIASTSTSSASTSTSSTSTTTSTTSATGTTSSTG